MKIALVHTKFEKSGGAERYAVGLAEELLARGHELHLFGRRCRSLPAGARFHRIPALPFGRALKASSFRWGCDRLLRPASFDVVQGLGKTTCQTVHRAAGGVHRAFMQREGRARQTLFDRTAVRIEDALFTSRRLRAIICPSRWTADLLVEFYPRVSEKLHVIPNGVDTLAFSPGGRETSRSALFEETRVPADAALCLFVATNFSLKGLDTAVAALAHLPRAHLLVAGGDDPARFRSQALALGVGDRVHFLGRRSDLTSLYRSADVLLHPTRYDPFANVCLEALACGTPVVTTRTNGFSDLLEPGGPGTVVTDPSDGKAVAEAAEGLLDRGQAGRDEAVRLAQGNDRKAHARRVEALYLELPRHT